MRVPMILPHELLNFLSEPGICRTFCFHENFGRPVESQKKTFQILFVVKLWFTPLLRILPTIKEQYVLTTLGFNQCIACIIYKIYIIFAFSKIWYVYIYSIDCKLDPHYCSWASPSIHPKHVLVLLGKPIQTNLKAKDKINVIESERDRFGSLPKPHRHPTTAINHHDQNSSSRWHHPVGISGDDAKYTLAGRKIIILMLSSILQNVQRSFDMKTPRSYFLFPPNMLE